MFRFFGETYNHARDYHRLKNHVQRVFSRLLDGKWHTITDLQAVGGSAARTRISNLKIGFQMPIDSRATDDTGKLWEYRLALDEVDPEMARRVLENDLTDEIKTRLSVAKERTHTLRKELHRFLDRIPDERLDEIEGPLRNLIADSDSDSEPDSDDLDFFAFGA